MPEEFKKPSSRLQDCIGQQGVVGGLHLASPLPQLRNC